MTAAPSEQLQAYTGSNLEHLLGPLNEGALPRAELMKLEVDYQTRLAAGTAVNEKAMLQAAVQVCAALKRIMDEREKAVASMTGAEAQNSNAQGSTKLHAGKKNDFALDQKRREIRQGQSDSRFIAAAARDSADRHWEQHQEAWRSTIQQLLVRERQAEAAREAAPVAPPALATASAETDPVVGQWILGSGGPLTLLPDHTISGGRHGVWSYRGTNDRGRNYQLQWNPPKNWTDYLVLSSDGNSLNGHTRGSKPLSVYRQ